MNTSNIDEHSVMKLLCAGRVEEHQVNADSAGCLPGRRRGWLMSRLQRERPKISNYASRPEGASSRRRAFTLCFRARALRFGWASCLGVPSRNRQTSAIGAEQTGQTKSKADLTFSMTFSFKKATPGDRSRQRKAHGRFAFQLTTSVHHDAASIPGADGEAGGPLHCVVPGVVIRAV
jgi:hypothetical protein